MPNRNFKNEIRIIENISDLNIFMLTLLQQVGSLWQRDNKLYRFVGLSINLDDLYYLMRKEDSNPSNLELFSCTASLEEHFNPVNA